MAQFVVFFFLSVITVMFNSIEVVKSCISNVYKMWLYHCISYFCNSIQKSSPKKEIWSLSKY